MSENKTGPRPPVVVFSTNSAINDHPGRRYQPKHPFAAGAITGGIEILITYPLEYTKCQMQLHQAHATKGGGGGAAAAAAGQSPTRTLDKGDSRNWALQNRVGNDRRGFRTSPFSFNAVVPAHKPNRLLSSVPLTFPTSTWGVMKDTVQHRGIAGLYRGLSSWLFFSFPRASFRFTTYEACLSAYERYQFGSKLEHAPPPPTVVAFMAGSVAGAVESATCMTPMHCIQIKMQQDAELARPRFKGFFHATRSIVREEGVRRGLLAGMGPTILKAATNNCIRFGVMSELSDFRRKQKGVSTSTALDAIETLTFGGMAGALSAVATHPIDTVKSNMQGNALHKAQFGASSLSCLRWIIKTGGVCGLFHGLAPRIVRVTLEVSLSFSLFDFFSRRLDAL